MSQKVAFFPKLSRSPAGAPALGVSTCRGCVVGGSGPDCRCTKVPDEMSRLGYGQGRGGWRILAAMEVTTMAAPKRLETLVRQVQVCELPETTYKMLPAVGSLDVMALEQSWRGDELETLEKILEGQSKAWLDQIT